MARKVVENITKLNEFIQFVEWCALPTHLKKIQDQGDFARSIGVSEMTLCAWRKTPGFYDKVRAEIDGWARQATPKVIQAMINSAQIEGKEGTADRKLFAQWIEKFKEESKLDVPGLDLIASRIGAIIDRGSKKK